MKRHFFTLVAGAARQDRAFYGLDPDTEEHGMVITRQGMANEA